MKKKGRYFKSTAIFVISLILVNLAIILFSFWYYRIEKKAFVDQKIKELTGISEIKIEGVKDWRNERLSDARYLFRNPRIKESFIKLLHEPGNTVYRDMFRDNLNGMFLNGKYESMAALDSSGNVFYCMGDTEGLTKFCHLKYDLLDRPYRVFMSDFSTSPSGLPVSCLLIPVVTLSGKDSVLAGSLALNIDLCKTFLPDLEKLPVPSESMHIVFSMDHARNDSGQVLAVRHAIPGSKASLTVEIKKSEGYAEVKKLTVNILFFTGLMILAFSSSLSFFWLRQKSELTVLETEKRMLIERFDMISKFANDAIIVYTSDRTILQVNDKAIELYGYLRDEILGMEADLLRVPELRHELPAMLEYTVKEGGNRFETLHIRKDGTTFPVEVSLRCMELMDSPCFLALIRDITQRKQFEKALITGEERLRLITNTVPLIVWTAKSDGTFDFVNSRFEALTGFHPLKENAGIDFIHKDDRERAHSYWKDAINNPVEHQIRLRMRMKDGSYKWFLCLAMPMCNEKGEIIRWYGSATDIDELENRVAQRTAEIKEHEKEIVKLNSSLQEHAYSLEYANKELEAFIFSVSHDLRAPLRAINGFSKILLTDYKDKLDGEGHKMLEKVWANAERMKQLIDDLLRLSRTGRHELRSTSINMKALFNSIIEEIRQIYPERKIRVRIKDIPDINGDLPLMKQVLLNLLSNAVKFSGKKEVSEIEIGSTMSENESAFYIRDNGNGFDMKYAHDLFGVFRRLNNAEEFEGTGVGLALVKRIIDKHGGRVWAYSEPSKGATFYFSIPAKSTANVNLNDRKTDHFIC